MDEHPILFNGEMVRAILTGTKTQTRRPIMPPGDQNRGSVYLPYDDRGDVPDKYAVFGAIATNESESNFGVEFKGPLGAPGDTLWVRETFRATGAWCGPTSGNRILYRADSAEREFVRPGGPTYHVARLTDPWRPSTHMPRWASRITLAVTSVRVERVQDISPDDCEEEGIQGKTIPSPVRGQPYGEYTNGDGLIYPEPRLAYEVLWDDIYADRNLGWDDNPWVWAVTFERVPERLKTATRETQG